MKVTVKSLAELDALVAEKVMGWHQEERSIWYSKSIWWIKGKEALKFLPSYCSEIAAAWQVAENMGTGFDGIYLSKLSPTWTCHMTKENGGECHECGDTAPLAICLCALASVGIEVTLELPNV